MATTYKFGQERPLLTRYITFDLTGTTDVTLPSKLRTIVACSIMWNEEPPNDTYQLIAYPSGTNVIARCTHESTAEAVVKVVGTA